MGTLFARVHVCICIHTCMNVEARGQLQVPFPRSCPPCSLTQLLSLGQNLPVSLGGNLRDAPALGLYKCHHYQFIVFIFFKCGFCKIEFRFCHFCKANTYQNKAVALFSKYFLKNVFFKLCFYLIYFMCTSMQVYCESSAHEGQKRSFDPLELEL